VGNPVSMALPNRVESNEPFSPGPFDLNEGLVKIVFHRVIQRFLI
jgi:hypothetical protein